jgi:hypothetical protein
MCEVALSIIIKVLELQLHHKKGRGGGLFGLMNHALEKLLLTDL